MKTFGILLALLSATLLTGCMALAVPKTTITGTIGGQPFSLSSPKDSTLTNLDITASTNGAMSIHVGSLVTVMNPQVITTTGDAQAKMITAVANGVSQGLGVAAGAAAAAAVRGP